MRIFGLAGWSGSGKTTLMTALIPEFVSRGVTVSTVKHAHHAFDIDQPGKDSWRHRQAGAREVMVASDHRWALMHEPLLHLDDPFIVAIAADERLPEFSVPWLSLSDAGAIAGFILRYNDGPVR